VLEAGARIDRPECKLEARTRTNRPKRKLKAKLPPLSLSFSGYVATKKAMTTTIIAFFFGFVATKKATTAKLPFPFCFWFCCIEEGDNNKAAISFLFLVLLH